MYRRPLFAIWETGPLWAPDLKHAADDELHESSNAIRCSWQEAVFNDIGDDMRPYREEQR